MYPGYYRFPTIHFDQIVYVCEDDLWTVSAAGGQARRLTSNLGEVSSPSLSPDGEWLSFVGREDGQPEIYLMPAGGGPARRLTYLGSNSIQTAGWTSEGKILFASNAAQPFRSIYYLYTLDPQDGLPEKLPVGPARAIAFGPQGGKVIGRNTADPARWKRYLGGTAGQLWIDPSGDGDFHPLIQLKGNLACPMWIGERIYFLSDHEGIGNLYSCLPSGQDLQRHTDHTDFYARNASTDGRSIVYHAGADLYRYDVETGKGRFVQIEQLSPRVQRNRKFTEPGKYLESAALHPKGHALAITARGQLFSFANWEGAVIQYGSPEAGVRYRLPRWLNDGRRVLAVDDASGEDAFVILDSQGLEEPVRLDGLDTGRPVEIAVNPKKDQIIFSNHRYELMFLDLETRELAPVDRGVNNRMAGADWSPDGEWVVYSVSISLQLMALKLWNAATRQVFPLLDPVLRDVSPVFDPQGRYIYFLSYRTFDPVPDSMQFEFNFPRGVKPYLITLQKDLPSPFIPVPHEDGEEHKNGGAQDAGAAGGDGRADEAESRAAEAPDGKPQEAGPLQIDLEGIGQRIVAFPVDEGRYGRVMGTPDGKVVYSRFPVEGTLDESFFAVEQPAKGRLLVYDLDEQKEDTLVNWISDFDLNRSRKLMVIRSGNRLRVLKAGAKPQDENDPSSNRKSGWIDLSRVRVPVNPGLEWRQMFREAWRLQRDHFWNAEMSGLDWLRVYDCYSPLVERVASRSEFSDLVWEMQGELGTSHCYEIGGDYRPAPAYVMGSLGADFTYDLESGAWRLAHIVQGDAWDENSGSPLARTGVNIQPGDRLLSVNGQKLTEKFSPAMALVDRAGSEVSLLFAREAEDEPRSVTVKTLTSDMPARYREWVEANRRYVHAATGGRVGYIHIPDMGYTGYSEFHRGFLAEVDRLGLIVDLRYNGGGEVSPLILEKLARKRIGYDKGRWEKVLQPYPPESVLGPVVALTNEWAGSDGDIFSHGFKIMRLGPLLGKRTWGGVVGIMPRQFLVDGTITTQPEFSFWFKDTGWGVENYGVDPDIEVDNTPQDDARGHDAQLDRSIEEVLKLMEANPPGLPQLEPVPSRAMPKLPGRG